MVLLVFVEELGGEIFHELSRLKINIKESITINIKNSAKVADDRPQLRTYLVAEVLDHLDLSLALLLLHQSAQTHTTHYFVLSL